MSKGPYEYNADPSIYSEEKKILAERPSGGSRGPDYNWLKFPKPAKKGDFTYKVVRIIPRLVWAGEGADMAPVQPFQVHRKWWVRADEFRIPKRLIDPNAGQDESIRLVSIDDMDKKDWRKNAVDPINILRNELYASKHQPWMDHASEFSPRSRVWCNVIDMDDPYGQHFEQAADGSWTVHPRVWSFSATMLKKLINLGDTLGPIENPYADVVDGLMKGGRNIQISCERTGPLRFNIKYEVTPLDPSAIPEELHPILQSALDLESMRNPSSLEDLTRYAAQLDPRVGQQSQGYVGAPPSAPPRQVSAPPPMASPAPPAPVAAPPGPPAAPPAPVVARYTYQDAAGQQHTGSPPELAEIIKSKGGPSATGHVWKEGWEQWVSWNDVPEIRALVTPPAPPPPPAPTPPSAPSAPSGYAPKGGYGAQADFNGAPMGQPSAPPPPPSAAPPVSPPVAAPPAVTPPSSPEVASPESPAGPPGPPPGPPGGPPTG